MGQVFKARQVRLDRVVAIKVIRPDRLAHPEALSRFQREARAAARLAHPNVVTVHDCGLVGDAAFLVLEYVEGTDLGKLVRSGPLPVAQACEYARQAALGLQHAHERGLIHRDVKPSNLLLDARGSVVKVLDLGLALLAGAGQDQAATELTAPGAVLGTPAYLAPEQALDSHSVDTRADVYSLGCTLYHLLAGQPPFRGSSTTELLLKHQSAEPPPLPKVRPGVPAEVQAVVARMMAKHPEHRYQTPAEVVAALAPLAGGAPATVPTTTHVRPRRAGGLRRRLRWVGLGCAAAALALLVAWAVTHRRREDPARPSTNGKGGGLDAIAKLGGKISVDASGPGGPGLNIDLSNTRVTDDDLAHLEGLNGILGLSLVNARITSRGLAHVRGLSGLRWLDLTGTQVDDEGLVEVRRFTRLVWLFLNDTRVSNAGMGRLEGLSQLQTLGLGGTRVGDVGLPQLAKLPQLRALGLYNTPVTDEALKHVARLPLLEDLNLANVQVGDPGLAHLAALPRLRLLNLDGTKVSDAGLTPLGKLQKLEELYVRKTAVTDAGARRFQEALPRVKVFR
jgi:tRNA A-37 threonylcarbamoyl transferase component Bud32